LLMAWSGRCRESFNPHQRSNFAKAFVGDSLDKHKVLDPPERAVDLSVFNDPGSHHFADVRNALEFVEGGRVDVDRVFGGGYIRGSQSDSG